MYILDIMLGALQLLSMGLFGCIVMIVSIELFDEYCIMEDDFAKEEWN